MVLHQHVHLSGTGKLSSCVTFFRENADPDRSTFLGEVKRCLQCIAHLVPLYPFQFVRKRGIPPFTIAQFLLSLPLRLASKSGSSCSYGLHVAETVVKPSLSSGTSCATGFSSRHRPFTRDITNYEFPSNQGSYLHADRCNSFSFRIRACLH